MARVTEREYTYLSDKDIAATAFGTTPAGVAFVRDIQQAAFQDSQVDIKAATQVAADAGTKADSAQQTAAAATASASTAQDRADGAYTLANSAYTLANGKVSKDAGLPWAAPTGTASRAAFATYTAPTISNPPTQAEVQALATALQAHSRALKAVVDDLRANGALTS